MLLDKAKRTIRRHGMLSSGDRIVVAVSGGPDSVCLLEVLRELSASLTLSLHVAHLDHGFRGKGSADDARFVERTAASLGIPATVERRDVPAYCAARGLSAQEGAREVRYAFLEQVAAAQHARRIAVGHTANDQAETLLLRLIRGAGADGMSAIPPVRENIIRPLIDVTRREVLSFLADRGRDFVNDPSNDSPRYARNRIRSEVLPVLERFNPRVVEALAAEAALLRDENAALTALFKPVLDSMLSPGEGLVRIGRDAFLALPPALRRRVLRAAVAQMAGTGLSSVQAGDAVAFLEDAPTGQRLELPGGLMLEREYEAFRLGPPSGPGDFDVPVALPGDTPVPSLSLVVSASVAEAPADARNGANYLWQAVFDYDKITVPLRLRRRRPGDAICPAGLGGRHKKLQDLFTDEKVPRAGRDQVPVLAAGADVLWVAGLRTDERFLPGPDTKRVLVVTIRKDR